MSPSPIKMKGAHARFRLENAMNSSQKLIESRINDSGNLQVMTRADREVDHPILEKMPLAIVNPQQIRVIQNPSQQ